MDDMKYMKFLAHIVNLCNQVESHTIDVSPDVYHIIEISKPFFVPSKGDETGRCGVLNGCIDVYVDEELENEVVAINERTGEIGSLYNIDMTKHTFEKRLPNA